MVSEGFQRGLKPCGFRGVSEGSETVWFQRGLKPCGFRGVSEGSGVSEGPKPRILICGLRCL